MKKNRFCLRLWLVVAVPILLAIVCCVFAHSWNSNFVSMLSGLWSAVATVVLGLVAFKQNCRYKELSDKMDIRQNAPEFFVQTPSVDQEGFGRCNPNIMFACESSCIGKQLSGHYAFRFITLDKPVLHLKPISISIDGTNQEHIQRNNIEINVYKPYSYFGFGLRGINLNVQGRHPTVVTIQYENIYGIKYEKKYSFDIIVGLNRNLTRSWGSLSIAERVENDG